MKEELATPTETSLRSNELGEAAKTVTTVVYALQAASFLLGFTNLVAIVINYIKRDAVAGTWLETHFRWQIRTFWFGLLWGMVGLITTPIVVGWLILLGDAVWVIYRIVKGWLSLNDGKAMYAPA